MNIISLEERKKNEAKLSAKQHGMNCLAHAEDTLNECLMLLKGHIENNKPSPVINRVSLNLTHTEASIRQAKEYFEK